MDLIQELHGTCVCALGSLTELELQMYGAIKTRDLELVKKVFDQGLEPSHCFSTAVPDDGQCYTIMQVVIQEEYYEGLEYILNNLGQKLSGTTVEVAFMYAMKKKMITVLRLFLDAIIQDRVTMELSNAFRHAMYTSQYDKVAEIIKKNHFDVNFQATWGLERPLHIVVHHNRVELVKLLFENGALVDPVDRKGTTPLIVACSFASIENVFTLLQHGANPNHKASQDLYPHYSPLHATVCFSKNSKTTDVIISMLVRSGLRMKCESWVLKHTASDSVNANTIAWLQELTKTPQKLAIAAFNKIRTVLVKSHGNVSIIPYVKSLPVPPGLISYLTMQDTQP